MSVAQQNPKVKVTNKTIKLTVITRIVKVFILFSYKSFGGWGQFANFQPTDICYVAIVNCIIC